MELDNLSKSNANVVAAGLLDTIRANGYTASALVTKLLMVIFGTKSELEKQRETSLKAAEEFAIEKEHLLKLIYKSMDQVASSEPSEPFQPPQQPDSSQPPEPPQASEPNQPSEPLQSSQPNTLSIPARGPRAKSPKREIQILVNQQSTDVQFVRVDHPSRGGW